SFTLWLGLHSFWEKELSPLQALEQSLLPLSSKRTQIRLKSLLLLVWFRQIALEPMGCLCSKSTVRGLNSLRRIRQLPDGSPLFNSSPRLDKLAALAAAAFFHGPQSCRELIPEAAPSSPSFSVSEKFARYGSSALSGVEHLILLVGTTVRALICHFGSITAL